MKKGLAIALITMVAAAAQSAIIYSENFDVSPSVVDLIVGGDPANNTEILGGVLENTWAGNSYGFVAAANMYVTSNTDKMRAALYTITADQFSGADANAQLSFDVTDIWNKGYLEVAVYGINNPGVAGDAVVYDVLGGNSPQDVLGSGVGVSTTGTTASVTLLGYQFIGGLLDNDVAAVVKNWTIDFAYNGTDDVVLAFGADGNDGITANKRSSFDNIQVTAIPEPATLGLVVAVGGGIMFIRRRFMV